MRTEHKLRMVGPDWVAYLCYFVVSMWLWVVLRAVALYFLFIAAFLLQHWISGRYIKAANKLLDRSLDRMRLAHQILDRADVEAMSDMERLRHARMMVRRINVAQKLSSRANYLFSRGVRWAWPYTKYLREENGAD